MDEKKELTFESKDVKRIKKRVISLLTEERLIPCEFTGTLSVRISSGGVSRIEIVGNKTIIQ